MLFNLLKYIFLNLTIFVTFVDIDAQTRHDFTMTVDDKLREYIVVRPSGTTPAGGYPVVFMFHGTSGTGDQFFNTSGWKEKGQQEKFITVFPTSLKYCIVNSPTNNQVLFTKWFTGDLVQDQCPNLNQDFKDDVKFVRRMVDSIKAKFVINPNKIFAAGFSNGCSFSHKLAMHAPDIFSACAGVGSILFPTDSVPPLRTIPFWNIVGTLDERFILEYKVSPLPFNDSILVLLDSYINRMTKCLNLRNEYTKVSNQISNTYLFSKPNTGNTNGKFQFTLARELNHIYPNGINFPVSATNLFWEFFNQSVISKTRDFSVEKLNINISPNPANDDITIFSDYEINSVSIFNIQGQLVSEIKNINERSKTIDVKNFQQGLHFLQINTIEGIKSLKVLINRH